MPALEFARSAPWAISSPYNKVMQLLTIGALEPAPVPVTLPPQPGSLPFTLPPDCDLPAPAPSSLALAAPSLASPMAGSLPSLAMLAAVPAPAGSVERASAEAIQPNGEPPSEEPMVESSNPLAAAAGQSDALTPNKLPLSLFEPAAQPQQRAAEEIDQGAPEPLVSPQAQAIAVTTEPGVPISTGSTPPLAPDPERTPAGKDKAPVKDNAPVEPDRSALVQNSPLTLGSASPIAAPIGMPSAALRLPTAQNPFSAVSAEPADPNRANKAPALASTSLNKELSAPGATPMPQAEAFTAAPPKADAAALEIPSVPKTEAAAPPPAAQPLSPSIPALPQPAWHDPTIPPASPVPAGAAPLVFSSPRFGEEVAIQIARRLGGLAPGDELVLQIEPADMGRIRVELRFAPDGALEAVLSADQSRVLDQLRAHSADLHRSLLEAGGRADIAAPRFEVRSDAASASVAQGGQGSSSGPSNGGGSGGQPQHSARSFPYLPEPPAPPAIDRQHLTLAAGRLNLIA